MLKDIIIVINALIEANQLISRKKLWKWILIPGILYLLLFLYGFFNFGASGNDLIQWILSITGISKWLTTINDAWQQFFLITGSAINMLMILLSFLLIFKYLMFALLSPLFSYLEQFHDAQKNGIDFTLDKKIWKHQIIRILAAAARNLLWQLVYFISLYLISFIPIIGWVVPIFTLVMECYFMGLLMLDLPSDKQQLSISQTAHFLGLHKGLAISTGIVAWLCTPFYAILVAMNCMPKALNEK